MCAILVTEEKAIAKIQRYCAYQERSQQEVRDKLYSWGLHRASVEGILASLVNDGFLKEERFAIAFARGKFRIKKWGRNKIRKALKIKKVSEPLISIALKEIDQSDYLKTLRSVIRERSLKVKESHPLKKKYNVAAYVISRGFESELVWEEMKMDNSD